MKKLLLSMMIVLANLPAMAQTNTPVAPAENGWSAFLTGLGVSGDTAHLIVTLLALALAVGAVLFMVRMVKRKDTPASPALSGSTKQILPTEPPKRSGHVKPKPVPVPVVPVAPVLTPAQKWGMPEGFDDQLFLQQAKASFVRMQAAWDKADTNDLREFTTPQVFAELKAQVEQRPQSNDVTDVVAIDAELLGIETMGEDHLASVKFNGMIKSSATAVAEPFAEVWNLAKPLNGSGGWMLAGIQQLS
ncbi:Tim44 domain-containing protein [Massilia sp. TWP1-3-3]|uniref:Tim44 domain-containing protein n=1 Tax=Massilia sp. TWP1-3-3 TaxID=2804573 RepID=UPI003CEE5C98